MRLDMIEQDGVPAQLAPGFRSRLKPVTWSYPHTSLPGCNFHWPVYQVFPGSCCCTTDSLLCMGLTGEG